MKRQDSMKVEAGEGEPCPRCDIPMQRWKHADQWKPPKGKGYYVMWDECFNPECSTRQVMPKEFYRR